MMPTEAVLPLPSAVAIYPKTSITIKCECLSTRAKVGRNTFFVFIDGCEGSFGGTGFTKDVGREGDGSVRRRGFISVGVLEIVCALC